MARRNVLGVKNYDFVKRSGLQGKKEGVVSIHSSSGMVTGAPSLLLHGIIPVIIPLPLFTQNLSALTKPPLHRAERGRIPRSLIHCLYSNPFTIFGDRGLHSTHG
ncbi:MAG: hypothetical protein HWN65_14335 [Candidatus Helarchaeota archaeon]|nr:hypothetical protein [Candidatus Helarchaeota archaeon]